MKGGSIIFEPLNHGGEHFKNDVIRVTSDAPINNTIAILIHELGHRLMSRLGLFDKIKIAWKHFDMIPGWHPTQYAKTNYLEMFAEVFLYYCTNHLNHEQTEWMDNFIQQARK